LERSFALLRLILVVACPLRLISVVVCLLRLWPLTGCDIPFQASKNFVREYVDQELRNRINLTVRENVASHLHGEH